MPEPQTYSRRNFLATAAALPIPFMLPPYHTDRQNADPQPLPPKIRLSCNLYSFNAPLQRGAMSLEEVIRFCAGLGFDAVDPTAYYFPHYPHAPEDDYIYAIKQQVSLLGMDISGTGVRTDFTLPEGREREDNLALVRRWVNVAAKLGAPMLRVFAGKEVAPAAWEKVLERVVKGIQDCVAYGRQKGVMIVLQNHHEFLKTAAQVLRIREQITSGWFGLNVDIGSLRHGDPYQEIAELAPYAYTWQIKEHVYHNGKEEKTDMQQIISILQKAKYRGYIPLETLGTGDPKVKITRFLEEVRQVLS